MNRLWLFLLPSCVFASVTTSVVGVTPTQAIIAINLSAPNGSPCTVEISESNIYSPLVHDVDPSLFSGSNLSNRTGAISGTGQYMFVAGKGDSETGSNGQLLSRALAANTTHYYRINAANSCDSGSAATGSFTTAMVPSGRLYNDPIPSSWPHFYGGSRSVLIDPQTGVKMIELNRAGENYSALTNCCSYPYYGGIAAYNTGVLFYDPIGTWTGSGPYTLSTTSTNPLAISVNFPQNSWAGTYETLSGTFISYLNANITGFDPATESVDVCLSLAGGGNRCDSPVITKNMPASSSSTAFGGTTPGMTDWGANFLGLDPTLASQHTGTVTVVGSVLTWASGNFFRPQANGWIAGTRITLTGGCTGTYYAASAPTFDQGTITLTSSPTCTSGTVSYTVTPLTVLLKKHAATAGTITISDANFDYSMDYGMGAGSSAMQDGELAVSPVATATNPPGYLVGSSAGYYLVQPSTPAVNFIGRFVVGYHQPSGNASPDNHGAKDCPPVAFSLTDPNTIWCVIQGFQGTLVYKVVYSGSYTAPPGGDNGVLPQCTGSNAPCITITGPLGGNELEAQFEVAYPTIAHSCCWAGFYALQAAAIGQLADGNLQLQSNLGGLQGVLGIFGVYDPNLPGFIAGRDSWSYYPFTDTAIHSAQLWRGTHVPIPGGSPGNWPNGGAPGPLSGADTLPGNGPYRTKTTTVMASATTPTNTSVVPAQFWPGGSSNPDTTHIYTVTVEGGICDPSPYSIAATSVTTTGTTNVQFNSVFASRGWVGKNITIGGVTHTMTAYVDNSDMTTNVAFSAGVGSSAQLQLEPFDSGAGGAGHCGSNTQFFLRDWAPGDIIFAGAPSGGIVPFGSSAGYEQYQATFGTASTPEAFMVLSRSGSTLTLQGKYDGTNGHVAWPSGTYLYQDSGVYIGESDVTTYIFGWDYHNDPTGALGKASFDAGIVGGGGHEFTTDYAAYGFSNQKVANGGPCAATQTDWAGQNSINCLVGRYGQNMAYTSPSTPQMVTEFSPAFAGLTGSSLTNNSDDHPFAPYFTMPQMAISAHIWNGHTSQPATGTDTGSGVLKFSAAQRGCSTAANCLALEKALPLQVNCGQVSGTNVSGPSASITTSSPIGAFASILNANEGISGTVAGDLVMYCPGSEKTSYDAGITSGGDHLDTGAYFKGPHMYAITRDDFSRANPHGEHVQYLGHGLLHPRFTTPFYNARATPDGQAVIAQVPGLDGSRTVDVVFKTGLDPTKISDSISEYDFSAVSVSLNAPAGLSIDHAFIEFGYPEYGDPASGLFCTSRQENCARGAQAAVTGQANPYSYETTEAGFTQTACSSSCTIKVPAISERMLYYRAKYVASGSVVSTSPLNVVAVP